MILENTDAWRLDYNAASYNDKRQGWTMVDKQAERAWAIPPGDASVVFACRYDAMKKAHKNPNSHWFQHTWGEALEHLFLEHNYEH